MKNPLEKLKALFVVESENADSNVSSVNTEVSTDPTIIPTEATTQAQAIVAKNLLKKLESLLVEKNTPGYDFLEYMNAYNALPQTNENFDIVYIIARSNDTTVTKTTLLESAKFYLGLIEQEFQTALSAINTKRSELDVEKKKAEHYLDESITAQNTLINELEEKLEAAKKHLTKLVGEKNTINEKYQSQYNAVDVNKNALDTVVVGMKGRIEAIKSGIENHVK